MSGSSIGGVIGGVVGSFFGPFGSQIGFMLGSAIGGYIDPDIIKQTGPRLNDAVQQTSRDGVPITFGYGTFRTTGNIIWRADAVEHINTTSERQGKGGPVVKTTTYTYTRSYAIGICEGPIVGLLIAKRNGVVVYDARTDAELTALGLNAQQIANLRITSSKFLAETEFYVGNETQTASPTIEAVLGAGNVSGYRGLCYMVRPNEDVTELRKAIPQWEFVICGQGTSETVLEPDLLRWWPLDDASTGGTAREIIVGDDGVYSSGVTQGGPLVIGSTSSAYFSDFGQYMVVAGSTGPQVKDLNAWSTSCWYVPTDASAGSTFKLVAGYYTSDWALATHGWGFYMDGASNMEAFASYNDSGGTNHAVSGPAVSTGQTIYIVETWEKNPSDSLGTHKLYVNGALVDTQLNQSNSGKVGAFMVVGGGYALASNYQFLGYVSDVKVYGRALTAQEVADKYQPMEDYLSIPDAGGEYVDNNGNFGYINNTQVTREQVSHADIVTDLCARIGIDASQIDVTDLESMLIDGYGISTTAGVESMIAPLMSAGFYDAGEWDGKLRFVARGGDPVLALTVDDLAERDGDAIEQERMQEAELLRKVTVSYVSPSASYTTMTQNWERRSGTVQAKGESAVEIPITCTDEYAARIAEKRGKVAWAEPEKLLFSLPYRRSAITPTDVVTLTDFDGNDHRLRVMQVEQDSGVLLLEASRDRKAAYSSSATGVTPGGPTGPSTGTLRGPTILRAMNLSSLTTADDKPGIYIAVTGVLSGWEGCIVYLSVDGGVSEQPVLTATTRATIGNLSAACTSSSEPISVEVYDNRTLSSVTVDQIAARQNAAAIISAGVAEVVQFQTATATSTHAYDLTDTTRGLNGTTAASHSAGDDFVLLDGAVYFVPIDPQYAGETLIFHAVTLGTDPDANTETVSIVFDPPTFIVDGGEVTP